MNDNRRQDSKVNCAACGNVSDGLGCAFHRQVAVGHFIPLNGLKFDRFDGELAVYVS